MNGLQMLLKGFGIEIDPEEIVRMVRAMAEDIANMRASIKSTEAMVKAMSEDDFWTSENALQRSQVLQHPAIMAQAIELLQQEMKELKECLASMSNKQSSM